jgi:hypothetical protein
MQNDTIIFILWETNFKVKANFYKLQIQFYFLASILWLIWVCNVRKFGTFIRLDTLSKCGKIFYSKYAHIYNRAFHHISSFMKVYLFMNKLSVQKTNFEVVKKITKYKINQILLEVFEDKFKVNMMGHHLKKNVIQLQ